MGTWSFAWGRRPSTSRPAPKRSFSITARSGRDSSGCAGTRSRRSFVYIRRLLPPGDRQEVWADGERHRIALDGPGEFHEARSLRRVRPVAGEAVIRSATQPRRAFHRDDFEQVETGGLDFLAEFFRTMKVGG